jgi:hypothetical protein
MSRSGEAEGNEKLQNDSAGDKNRRHEALNPAIVSLTSKSASPLPQKPSCDPTQHVSKKFDR